MTRWLVAFALASGFAACGFHEVDETAGGDGGDQGTASGNPSTGGSGGGGPGAGGSGAAGQTSAVSTGAAVGGGGGSGPPDEPGFINCGSTTCDGATQKCCSQLVCEEKDFPCAPDLMSTNPFTEMECDDELDCPNGQACCVETHPDFAGLYYLCKAEPCGLHPSCTTAGGDCAGGLVCAADATESTGAKCVDPSSVVACTGQADCSAAAPVCCVVANGASCVAYGECGGSSFECDEPGDCGAGYVCCGDAGGASECAGSCSGPQLCDDAADCAGGTCTGNVGDYAACE